jgi:hypothetical protein
MELHSQLELELHCLVNLLQWLVFEKISHAHALNQDHLVCHLL